MKGNLKNILFYLGMIVVVLILVYALMSGLGGDEPTYSEIVEYFQNIGDSEKEAVKSFELDSNNKLTIKTTENNEIVFVLQDRDRFYEDCYVYVTDYNKQAAAPDSELEPIKYNLPEPTTIPWWVSLIPYVVIFGLLIFLYIYVINQASGKGGKINSFGKSRAKVAVADAKNKVLFSDVAGAEEEKEELQEIVEFLKDPGKYTKLGAKIPHGVLLVGPPGTGKTLLAKAVAGEAGVPFFSISGSDFVEMYVGVGASRVRDLFETARKHPASIIFIDEIDAVGRHRGAGLGGGHDEREQTLNQLLVEMDGFSHNEGVIVMAATNRADILDPALLRPGRFDRQITVNYPDVKGREEILKVHAKGKPLAGDVDLKVVARRTPYFTGADLENVLNEGAILTARAHEKIITMKTLEEAITRVSAGPEKKSRKVSEQDKKVVCYHEAGHAIVSYRIPECDRVHEVSIIPRGRAAGYTMYLPDEEVSMITSRKLVGEIASLLAGHCAEEMVLGDVSTGSTSDLKRATQIARSMVTEYGMSEKLGPVFLGEEHEVFLGRDFSQTRSNVSDAVASTVDSEVHDLLSDGYRKCKEILGADMDKLHALAKMLAEHEKVDGKQFEALMEGREVLFDGENASGAQESAQQAE